MDLKTVFDKADRDITPGLDEVKFLLETTGKDLAALYDKADSLRREYMGDEVYLRGIMEFSNFCVRNCSYCGIYAGADHVKRYRIPDDEIVETCGDIERRGFTTVVLQSGEDPFYTREKIGNIIRRIKQSTSLAVTLSVGERDAETFRHWKRSGMDRYLLRFETSDAGLFSRCHPDADLGERLECLRVLKELGVQTGSGFLIGLPGETLDALARNIVFCTGLSLDMIGVGPFIPHGKTRFNSSTNPFDNEIFFKTVAVLRLLNKRAHIPSTTAFDAAHPRGRDLLLMRGCNVFMPNATPAEYRKHYILYPGKPCVDESSEDCAACVIKRLSALGRKIGRGPGHSLIQGG